MKSAVYTLKHQEGGKIRRKIIHIPPTRRHKNKWVSKVQILDDYIAYLANVLTTLSKFWNIFGTYTQVKSCFWNIELNSFFQINDGSLLHITEPIPVARSRKSMRWTTCWRRMPSRLLKRNEHRRSWLYLKYGTRKLCLYYFKLYFLNNRKSYVIPRMDEYINFLGWWHKFFHSGP